MYIHPNCFLFLFTSNDFNILMNTIFITINCKIICIIFFVTFSAYTCDRDLLNNNGKLLYEVITMCVIYLNVFII